MKTTIKHINNGLIVATSALVIAGLILIIAGNQQSSFNMFFGAAIFLPLLLASKGIEYMLQNLLHKALLSIIMLSLVCLLSIVFVFV